MADATMLSSGPGGDSMTVWACGVCRFVRPSMEMAEKCCLCARCSTIVNCREKSTWRGNLYCDDCEDFVREFDKKALREKMRALPVVEHSGPVWVYDTGTFHSDLDSALDLLDDDVDPDDVIIHPCDVQKVHSPDLYELVHEHWYEQFEDGIYEDDLPKPVAEALATAQVVMQKHAPEVWFPNLKVRVRL